MAVVKKLYFEEGKSIPTRSEIVAEYNMDDEYFSIWSYINGDMDRHGTCSQNMQFDRQQARELMTALGRFLNKHVEG